jgi:curli production assembly/transport component CsgG
MIRLAAASLFLLFLTGCAQMPQWSEGPADCEYGEGQYKEGWSKDLYTGARQYQESKQICVEGPEVIKLPSYIDLLALPAATNMPVVAVYRFADKTGQRKDSQTGQSFSTAVTQGGTELLIDALKTAANGKWFRVVEREGIDALVRERQIVRSTRDEAAKKKNEESPGVGALLFAGMLIEGGIIGYDSNIRTGGRGARTLGIGFSRSYKQDVVTVSMRAVSVLTGEILLNVQTRKTILSYGSGGDIFRFIEAGTQLLEYEDGVGNNESVTYAVRTAIEAAVLEMVYQGHDRGFWEIEAGHRHPHQRDHAGTNEKHNLDDK